VNGRADHAGSQDSGDQEGEEGGQTSHVGQDSRGGSPVIWATLGVPGSQEALNDPCTMASMV
jgi:hypothetical protein